jgi:uncharacterized membrane protein (UPF0182 family)
MRRRIRIGFLVVIGLGIIFLIIVSMTSSLIEKWLWMRQLGYQQVFWNILSIQGALFGLTFACVFVCIWGSLRFVIRNAPLFSDYTYQQNGGLRTRSGITISPTLWKAAPFLIASMVALIFALISYPQWDTYLRFRWGGAFGEPDPIFNTDIGFYLFRLPFYELIQNALTGLAVATLLVTFIAYAYLGALPFGKGPSQRNRWRIMGHLSILFLFFIGTWAWGYYLDRFELLYATRGVVYGMGYTDDHVTRIVLWIMLLASAALGLIILINLLTRRFRITLVAVGCYFALSVVILLFLPGLVQKYKVAPNELELETPYLRHNIASTRKAFQLDGIKEKTYPALRDLKPDEISSNRETIDNIRLWDWRPILETYRQTQEIRLYYQFYEVDVDRYRTEDGYHQVMLSARELAPELPAKARTWVNQYLQFTHGYGLVMNFVSKKGEEGLPQYIIEDIPPVSLYHLAVDRPALYYGEKTPGYRIVSTGVKEFDYPKGDKNVYTNYQGTGGIPLDSLWKRALFAWTRSDINILLTSYLEPESRIQIWRRVQDRVAKIAPFLQLDSDPYLVLSEGKLYWIQDAYTVSDRFPYSEPYGRSFSKLNYIRNSVKVVVDAYEGSVLFFVADPKDPVLRCYREAFPGLFRDLTQMPKDLKAHLRYPEELFTIQADMYRTYHMIDPQVFYNQEDLWASPMEKYAGAATEMRPYYILMRLPGTKELQYLLMTPFTPKNRDNMIAWMAAKCDFPQYGQVLVYQLPKERLTFGPIQVEAMIDQNTLISEQLSLWDQRGSRVIRGNLIVIPIENAFLYVEPVYLTAEGTNIPQLKRVIVISGSRVVMAPTLHKAIEAVFGAPQPEVVKTTAPAGLDPLTRAREDLKKAEEAMRQGKWEDFGRAMQQLKQSLGQ